MPVDNDLKKLMRDLGDAFERAIAASPAAADAARRIRQQGFSLYLALDREQGNGGTRIELGSGKAPAKPGFLLNQGDVSFLESVGIDPTRPSRRRRTP